MTNSYNPLKRNWYYEPAEKTATIAATRQANRPAATETAAIRKNQKTISFPSPATLLRISRRRPGGFHVLVNHGDQLRIEPIEPLGDGNGHRPRHTPNQRGHTNRRHDDERGHQEEATPRRLVRGFSPDPIGALPAPAARSIDFTCAFRFSV